MRAALFRYFITFQKLVNTKSDSGAVKQIYKDYNRTRAQVIRQDGARGVNNNEIIYDYDIQFFIRYSTSLELDEKMIILFEDKKYRITSIVKDQLQMKTKIKTKLINE